MDFASLMKSQIAASKPKPSASNKSDEQESSSKYVKRSELESARHAAYLADQAALESLREEKAAKKRKLEDEAAEKNRLREEKRLRLAEESRKIREEEEAKEERERRKRLGLPETPEQKVEVEATGEDDEDEDDDELPPEEDILRTFRKENEPVHLFGETKAERNSRYLQLVDPQPKNLPIATTLRLLPESEMKIPTTVPKSKKERRRVRRQLASYFTLLLSEWASAMASRSQEVQESSSGKSALASMLGARNDLIPLFRRLEKDEVDEAVLQGVMDIVHDAQERRYVDANKKYLLLSIGKAAWPIGVTMVGIHERSAREKLHETDKTAHIMSDETTRKFLQSIKRCLSFAQTRWPPDDHLQLMG